MTNVSRIFSQCTESINPIKCSSGGGGVVVVGGGGGTGLPSS